VHGKPLDPARWPTAFLKGHGITSKDAWNDCKVGTFGSAVTLKTLKDEFCSLVNTPGGAVKYRFFKGWEEGEDEDDLPEIIDTIEDILHPPPGSHRRGLLPLAHQSPEEAARIEEAVVLLIKLTASGEEFDTWEALLERAGLYEVQNSGDGHCLFLSLELPLYHSQSEAQVAAMRKICAIPILEEPDKLVEVAPVLLQDEGINLPRVNDHSDYSEEQRETVRRLVTR
jgi:hypothetical protein